MTERLGPVVATVNLREVSAAADSARAARRAGADRVEVRVDTLAPGQDPTPLLALAREMPLLVSGCREAVGPGEIALLRRAQREGAWADVPWEPRVPDDLWGLDPKKLVLSWHGTGGVSGGLGGTLSAMRSRPAACYKVVPAAADFEDVARVKSLLEEEGLAGDLCAFATGAAGAASRILCLAWGSAATYCSAPACAPAAPGQIPLESLLSTYGPREARADEPVYGLIGWPLTSSLSPALHNGWLRAADLPGRFVPLPALDLEAFFGAASALPLAGLAVTVPHKEAVMRRVAGTSRLAARAAACNTLLPTRSGWFGANTDTYGVRCALAGVPRGARSLLLGAGGAAASAALVLAGRGPLAIAARDGARARSLAGRFGASAVPWGERAAWPHELLVNATPSGQEGEESPFPPERLAGRWVFDMVVREGGTPLVRAARGFGLATIPGEAMLEAQARLQFRLFTGRRPPG